MERIDLLFWTDILSDHAKFQINALSSKEEKYIAEAKNFKELFKKYNELITSGQNIDMRVLENDTAKFIAFKKKIIYELLNHNIAINFSPSFVNHMVNEANEFLDMLHSGTCAEKTEEPPLYIKIWLADASGHASTLSSFMDLAEVPLIHQAELFKELFDKLGKKASEIDMIQKNLGIGVDIRLLTSETVEILQEFIDFSRKIGELLDNKKIMAIGTLSSDITSHFIKEHKYFIDKLKTCIQIK